MGLELRMKRRREDRIEVELPVRIFGIDSQGKPFNIRTETVDVTRLGARLHNVNCFSKAGEIVGLQYEEKKARFRVCWVGLPGTLKEGDVGVQLVESDRPIWDIIKIRSLPGAKKQSFTPEQMGMPSSRIAPGLISEERDRLVPPEPSGPALFAVQNTPPAIASGFEARSAPQPEIIRGYDLVGDSRPDTAAKGGDGRRQHQRLELKGGVEIHQVGMNQPYWGHIGDISHGGIYVQTIQPLPVDTFVNLLIRAEGVEIRSAALVRTSHPHVGMGLCFAEMDMENREKLTSILDRLESRIATPRPQNQAPARSSAIFMPTSRERDREKNEQRAEKPAINDELQLSQRLHEIASELRHLEQSLSQARVDARLQRNFREASEFTRQAAWAVQHFIEFQLTGRDPFAVFQQLDANRMKVLTELCRAASLDVDSKQMDTEGENIIELFRAVEALYSCLSRMHRRETATPLTNQFL